MAIFLGIDGGGSKTTSLIGDGHSVLGSGNAGGSNVVRAGESSAREALLSAIRQACGAAGVTTAQITRTCIGVAGAARPQIKDVIRRVLEETVSGEIEVATDMVIAREAAFGTQPGVIVIAGTGSVAYGVSADCRTARAGGWGFAISDEGSGHWIGRAAISAIMRAHDQAESPENSLLFAGISKAWDVKDREELVLAANASPARDFSGLFPVVLGASEAGDALALDVLHFSGDELAGLAAIVIRRLFGDAGGAQVAMTGGVFANSEQVREYFWSALQDQFPRIVVKPGISEPAMGALLRARRGTTPSADSR